MKIHDMPAFYSVSGSHYNYNNRVLQLVSTIGYIAIHADSGTLESKLLGINFDVYISQDQFTTQPVLNDILVIDGLQYQIITAPFKVSNFDVDSFYKLNVKTANIPNLPV